ncbi:hypothetical protein F0562_013593 [Nyssa sinensis]|uniref:Protein kinase domain-containing protein n=1 Tax=Nyssa sinensis TaxID=561372 RepID=A0A5J4ZQB5_9ASTE|nr:hypothetical protein F0562_013593 [Nyssa sinensis]
MAKPGCPEKCENVDVPYPFGIGPGCYLDRPFEITCNHSSNSTPIPFLTSRRNHVLNISLDHYVRVNSFAYVRCFNKSEKQPLEYVGYNWDQHFSYSETENWLIAIGCNIFAYMTDRNSEMTSRNSEMYISGCASLCNGTSNFVDPAPSCSGNGCCQATIPKDITSFGLYIDMLNPVNSLFSGNSICGISFVADKNFNGFNMFNVSNYTDSQVVGGAPVVLDWTVGNMSCHEATGNLSNYACKDNSDCINSTRGRGYQCRCSSGYRGNPYLPNGCQGVGIGAAILILVAIGIWLSNKLRERKRNQIKKMFFERNGGFLLQQQISSTKGNVEKTKLYSKEDLEKATDNFNGSRVLGKGGLGTVYKGMLSDGSIVAVKKSNNVDESQVGQFINEVIILSQVNHRNIVKLLGCCLETEVPILVYEYVSNGTLSHHLHDEGKVSTISWNKRLQIAGEVAGALAYLHSYASTAIFHRDIKSSNILLDENYRAVVSDFGLSRSIPLNKTHKTTFVGGTFGYLDPEYFHSGQLTDKSDVYAFGVVLVELLTGEEAVSSSFSRSSKSLVIHFQSSMKQNYLFEILETLVMNEGQKEEILAVAKLAERCLKLSGSERPSMIDVAANLDQLRRIQAQPLLVQNDQDNYGTVNGSIIDKDAEDGEEQSLLQQNCSVIEMSYSYTMDTVTEDSQDHVRIL